MEALERLLLREWVGVADERTKDLFLMDSFWQPLTLLVTFLFICYYMGPYYMRQHSQPFDVYYYLVWHNIFLVLTNMFFGIALLFYMLTVPYSLLCQPVGTKYQADDIVAYLLYCLLFLKIFELIDALVLVAKKAVPPCMLVFHHVSIVMVMWISVKYGPGGSAVFPTMLNSFVHVMVYLNFKFSHKFMNKKQTRRTFVLLYVIQFSLIGFFSATTIYLKCGYPIALATTSLLYNALLIMVYSRSMWELWCVNNLESIESSSSDDDSDDDDGYDSDDGCDMSKTHHVGRHNADNKVKDKRQVTGLL